MGLNPNTRALFFDVFGTCVDWRKTVTDTLSKNAQDSLDSKTSSLSSEVRAKAEALVFDTVPSIFYATTANNQERPRSNGVKSVRQCVHIPLYLQVLTISKHKNGEMATYASFAASQQTQAKHGKQ